MVHQQRAAAQLRPLDLLGEIDYRAVLWGVAVIGTAGLSLRSLEFFTRLMPGWMINVATIIHNDEALLAVGFIFNVHFCNTHFRPERFPIDTVVFTGGVPLEEFKRDRPRERQAGVSFLKTGSPT